MDKFSQTEKDKIIALVGSIIIASQSAELILKSFLPNVKQDALVRRRNAGSIQKKTLGELAGAFGSSLSGSEELISTFKQELARVVSERNLVTHHLFEHFGKDFAAGEPETVIIKLQEILSNIEAFSNAMKAIHDRISSTTVCESSELVLFSDSGNTS